MFLQNKDAVSKSKGFGNTKYTTLLRLARNDNTTNTTGLIISN